MHPNPEKTNGPSTKEMSRSEVVLHGKGQDIFDQGSYNDALTDSNLELMITPTGTRIQSGRYEGDILMEISVQKPLLFPRLVGYRAETFEEQIES